MINIKKVLFVATVVKTHIMVFHLPYLKWFQEKGYETHVCAKNDYENKEDCNIPYCDRYFDLPIERSPFKFKNAKACYRLKGIIQSNGYDIVHCHTPMGGVLTRIAANRARKKGVKIVYTAHGFHFFKGAPLKNWLLYYPAEKMLSRLTDTLITINEEDYTIAQKFKARQTVYVPGIGVDVKKFGEAAVDRAKKREELGLGENNFAILSVGELIRRKNHEVVLKALAKINNPDIVYIICGDGELAAYLKNIAEALNVNVRFMGFRKDIPEISAAVDLFVLSSYHEGLPVALMEAMASGLPVVCAKTRGNTDLIENGKGGFLVEPDDVEGFAGSIERIANSAPLRKIMGEENRSGIEKLDINNVLPVMAEIYSALMDDH